MLQVHHSQLETVLPKPGGHVMMLSPPHAGVRGTLIALDEEKFQVQVRSAVAPHAEVWLDYEAVCKLSTS